MRTSTVLLLAGGAGIVWWLFKKGRALTSLQFFPRDISLSGGTLNLVLGVGNPTSTSLTLRSVLGGLYLDNNRIADVSNYQQIVLAPNAETDITLTIAPNLFGIASDVVNTIKNGLPPQQSLELRATANIDNQPFSADTKFS